MHRYRSELILLCFVGFCALNSGCTVIDAIVHPPAEHAAMLDRSDRLAAIGRVFENQGHYRQAQVMYRKALKAEPDNVVTQDCLQDVTSVQSEPDFRAREESTLAAVAMADSLTTKGRSAGSRKLKAALEPAESDVVRGPNVADTLEQERNAVMASLRPASESNIRRGQTGKDLGVKSQSRSEALSTMTNSPAAVASRTVSWNSTAEVGNNTIGMTAALSSLLPAGCSQREMNSAAVDGNNAMLNELRGSLDTTPESDSQLGSSFARNSRSADSSAQNRGGATTTARRSTSQDSFSGFRSDGRSLVARQTRSVVPAAANSPDPTANYQRSANGQNVQKIGGTQQLSPGEQGHRLELRLSPGDQFPLIQSVTQILLHKSAQCPASAEAHLELHMHMRVEGARADGILMSVRYTRVVYRHDLNGQQLAFDSAAGRQPEAAELLPYAGMVNNGFAFWLGRNNKIRELLGYQEFLQRCVQTVPVADQQPLLQELAARFGDNGVASFIDEAIGLLPYSENLATCQSVTVSAGDVWCHERQMTHPVPLTLKSTCRLLAIDQRTAEIDMTGRITQPANSFRSGVQVRDGWSMGSCVIDQTTGLPLRLNRSTCLNMLVATENGQTVEQEKRVQTTIQTQPATGRSYSHAASTTSYTNLSQAARQPRPMLNFDQQPGSKPRYDHVMASPGFPNARNSGQAQYLQSAAAGHQFGI